MSRPSDTERHRLNPPIAFIVLAGTMLALLSSDVINIGQTGLTIAIRAGDPAHRPWWS